MKIILDTNIWISFLLGKRLSALSEIFSRNDIHVYVSKDLIEELIIVVSRSKFANKITSQSIDNLIELINLKCNIISSDIEEETGLRDKKDLFILGMAKNIPANYIITGDRDLLVLKSYKQTQIITFSEFQNLI